MPDGWVVRRSAIYLEQLQDRQYRRRVDEFESLIERLLRDPYSMARSEQLRHNEAGLRSAGRQSGATRIIFKICEECRVRGEGDRWPLDCCENAALTGARTVNILCLSEHYADMPAEFDFDV